eukprot:11968006-Heterocapsa_arctica.AAC.1
MAVTSGTASAQWHNKLRQFRADEPRLLHCLARLQKRLQRRLAPSGTLAWPLESHSELAVVGVPRSLPDAAQR